MLTEKVTGSVHARDSPLCQDVQKVPENVQSFPEQIEVLPNAPHQNADRLELAGR